MEENIKKPVCVMERSVIDMGLFWIYFVGLAHSMYAKDKGYIPLIDLKHKNNQYFKDGRIYKDNVWEYFFKQPGGIGIYDIKEEDDVLFSEEPDTTPFGEAIMKRVWNDLEDKNKASCEIFDIVQLNDEMTEYLETGCREIIGDETEILGILCRGTDYTKLRPKDHQIQPRVDDVIKKAKKLYKKFHYKKIWLATEDMKIYQRFKDEFGEILIENNQYKFDDTGKHLLRSIDAKRENHRYNLAKEYMLSMYILSRCKYLIGGIAGGTIGIWWFSRGFKNQKYLSFFEIGRYKYRVKARYTKFSEKLFSIKDEIKEERRYKVIRILGIKFRLLYGTNRNKAIGFERD